MNDISHALHLIAAFFLIPGDLRRTLPHGGSALDHFAPLSALAGGILIGVATTILWIANGRQAGVSGIAGGIFPFRQGDALWRILFVAGLPVGALIGLYAGPKLFSDVPADIPPFATSLPLLLAAGVLVGVGTRLGRGCTSGHGICGLSRLSKRSFVAVVTFMGTAALTVFIMKHVL